MDGMLTRYDIVLTNLGEKMSDDEVDELLKAVDTSSGEINYTGMLTARNTLIDRLELTV
jgi:Ca2+-binding EF-hand superfamily protein